MLLGLGLLFLVIVLWEVPSLVRKKLWGELAAFTFLWLLALVYSFGQVLELPLPNPHQALSAVFQFSSL